MLDKATENKKDGGRMGLKGGSEEKKLVVIVFDLINLPVKSKITTSVFSVITGN